MHLLLYEIPVEGQPYLMLAEMLNLYFKVVLWLAVHNNYTDNCAMPTIWTTGGNVEAGLHAPSYLLLLELSSNIGESAEMSCSFSSGIIAMM